MPSLKTESPICSMNRLVIGALFLAVIYLHSPVCCVADINVDDYAISGSTDDYTNDPHATSPSSAGVTGMVTSVTSSPSTTVPTTIVASTPTTTTPASVTAGNESLVSTTGCGTTKGCMHYPEGCQSPGNCAYVLTWSTTESGFVDFELMAPATVWVGVGLSTDSLMRDDSVTHCIVNTTTSPATVTAGLSYNINSSKSNRFITANTTIVRLKSAAYVNGTLHCRLQRSIPGESIEIFPLDGSYFLFFGAGSRYTSGTGLQYHDKTPYISPNSVNITKDFVDLTPEVTTVPTSMTTTMPATEGCGATIGCFNDTLGNAVLYSMTDDGLNIEFEIVCNRSGSGWCSVGFSYDQIMASTSVIDCILNSNGAIAVKHSYNSGYSNIDVADSSAGIRVLSTTNVGEIFSCHFYRNITISPNNSNDKIYDLDQAYYLMLGVGSVSTTVLNSKLKHTIRPLISTSMIDVRFSSTSPANGSSTTASTPAPAVTPGGDGTCGVTVGCFSASDGSLVTYSMTSDGLDVEFEISCSPSNAAGWCAVGFSNNDRMPDTSVIDCIRHVNGSFTVQHSYNEPSAYSNTELGNPDNYIRVIATSFENGVLKCSFSRRIIVTNGNDKIFSLDTPYFLLIGKGPMATSGVKAIHELKPAASSEKIDVRVTSIASEKGGCGTCLVRAHGCLMITAWILLVSTSIILARYFKTAWPGDKLCDTAVWFAAHRFMMVLALFCTAAGFIIIFVYNDGRYAQFPDDADSYFKLHAPLGIIVMILVVTNPIMSIFRCHPGTAKRPIFNWLHWLVGTTCHILAIITVFIGIKIGEKSTGDEHVVHSAIFWILIGFVVFHCIVEVTLTAHKMAVDIAAKSAPQAKYEKQDGEEDSAAPKKTSGDLKFRYTVLALYGITVLGIWLATIILIGSGSV